MKTRRILSSDIQSALREVRRTLGPDAVIMTTRETGDGIEVVAGVLPASAAAPHPGIARSVTEPARSGPSGLSGVIADLARPASRRHLRASPQRCRRPADELVALGFASELRRKVMDDIRNEPPAEQWAAALGSLTTHIPVEGNCMLRDGGRLAVVGGTGVGKTTTVVKLAAHFARMHGPRSVALVNADNLRVGASDQLRRYAKLMGLAVCHVRGPSELGPAFERLKDRKLVLVDTAGASHQDMRLMEELQRLRSAGTQVSGYLAVSFNTQLAALERAMRAYEELPLHGCILTKSDEAVSFGPALSFVVRHALPVSFVTTGTKVPADIRVARADWLIQHAEKLLRETRRAEAACGELDELREVS